MKTISHLIMSSIIGPMCPFDYDAGKKSKKWGAKAERCKKILSFEFERQFSPAESAPAKIGFLGENDLKHAVRKRHLWTRRDKICVQEV